MMPETPAAPSTPVPSVVPVPHLLVLGLGYCARAVVPLLRRRNWRVSATSRDPAAAPACAGVDILPLSAVPGVLPVVTHVLSSAPPDEHGDPLLRLLDPLLPDAGAAPFLGWIGYLSTTGVYGDRDGGWVDEHTLPVPTGPRGRRRVDAERHWTVLAARLGACLDLFRLSGIYGPGRSVLEEVRAGRARRIDAPGHCFGRIHRDDIAAAVVAAIDRPSPVLDPAGPRSLAGPSSSAIVPRVLNLSDDLPAESAAVIAEAATLLGLPLPPSVSFAEASRGMSPMGLSFWNENRKVSSRLTQERLGLRWRYPTFREGLRAVLDAERSAGS